MGDAILPILLAFQQYRPYQVWEVDNESSMQWNQIFDWKDFRLQRESYPRQFDQLDSELADSELPAGYWATELRGS